MIKPDAFIWLANSGLYAGEFPTEFAIPRGLLTIKMARQMAGRSLWIIIGRGAKHYLYGHLTAAEIYRVAKGRDAGVFVLSADAQTSFRTLPCDKGGWADWGIIPHCLRPGVYAASKSDMDQIREIIGARRHGFGLSRPAKRAAAMLRCRSIEMLFARALSAVPFGDLQWSRNSKLTPYGDIIRKSTGKNPRAAGDIAFWDDMVRGVIERGYVCRRHAGAIAPVVDTDLRALDITAINTREFIAGKKVLCDMRKTAMAEKKHQAILGALVRLLTGKGLIPLFSRSVDLAMRQGDLLVICEIKSATAANFDGQARRGLVQIREYQMQFEKIYPRVLPVLIIGDIDNAARTRYFEELANHLGVCLFLYDERNIESVFSAFIARHLRR